ncbi:MAG: hypothetical protein ABSG76_24915, partial [Xanthobacteraceae bacterium]
MDASSGPRRGRPDVTAYRWPYINDHASMTVYQVNRRQLLGSSAIVLLMNSQAVHAAVVKGGLPWTPGS